MLDRKRPRPTVLVDQIEEENNVTFQQDGAPLHISLDVRDALHARFPHRWIGRSSPNQWPPRSPDLTPLDVFYGDT